MPTKPKKDGRVKKLPTKARRVKKEKRVKGWAVVDRDGISTWYPAFAVFKDKQTASKVSSMCNEGDRTVKAKVKPVTIIIHE